MPFTKTLDSARDRVESYEQHLRNTYRDASSEELIERIRAGTLTEAALRIAREELASRGETLNEAMTDEPLQVARPLFSDAELKKKTESWKVIPLHLLGGFAATSGLMMAYPDSYTHPLLWFLLYGGFGALGIYASMRVVRHVYATKANPAVWLCCLAPAYVAIFLVLWLLGAPMLAALLRLLR